MNASLLRGRLQVQVLSGSPIQSLLTMKHKSARFSIPVHTRRQEIYAARPTNRPKMLILDNLILWRIQHQLSGLAVSSYFLLRLVCTFSAAEPSAASIRLPRTRSGRP